MTKEINAAGDETIYVYDGNGNLTQKTKSQALVCIMRRLVNIVYGMMKNKTEYHEPVSEQ